MTWRQDAVSFLTMLDQLSDYAQAFGPDGGLPAAVFEDDGHGKFAGLIVEPWQLDEVKRLVNGAEQRPPVGVLVTEHNRLLEASKRVLEVTAIVANESGMDDEVADVLFGAINALHAAVVSITERRKHHTDLSVVAAEVCELRADRQ